MDTNHHLLLVRFVFILTAVTIMSLSFPAQVKATLIAYEITFTEEGNFANNPGTQHTGNFSIDDSLLIGGPVALSDVPWNFFIDIDGLSFDTSTPQSFPNAFFVDIDVNNEVTLVSAQIDDTLGTSQLSLHGSNTLQPGRWSTAGISNEGVYEISRIPEPASLALLGLGLAGLGLARRYKVA